MMTKAVNCISLQEITNLSQLFFTRVHRTPDRVAYHYFDKLAQAWRDLTWSDMAEHTARWQAAFKSENLSPGDRVALMLSNCPFWVMYEQAAMGLGLIVVPLYTNDRAENVSYIINDTQARILLLETAAQWQMLKPRSHELKSLQRIICIEPITDPDEPRLINLDAWLPDATQRYPLNELRVHKSSLATIVYTSGTTGKSKGVMLSHYNIFWNAHAGMQNIEVLADDVFLSFLPLSHMFERTAGYYLPMINGNCVIYARSVEKLAEDLLLKRPTVLITVPRIFERIYNRIKIQLEKKSSLARWLFTSTVSVGWHRFQYQQHKRSWHPKLLFWPLLYLLVARKILVKLGGRLRLAVSGGAPLSLEIARTFIGLGLTISQGYGLTEASPVISTNKLEDNDPESVGQALLGIETKLSDVGELLVRAPSVMLGYWNQDEATREVIDSDGWLHTGDIVRIENDHIYITGRIKEILVLSNGEKIPPANIEMAICEDPLFEQALVIGEQKPYLSALLVFNQDEWSSLAKTIGLTTEEEMLNHPTVHEHVLQRLHKTMTQFPGHAKIYRVYITLNSWTIENDTMTPTLKLKRQHIIDRYSNRISEMYQGH